MNIHQLDSNSNLFSRSSNLGNRKWKFAILAPKSSDEENHEKKNLFETKAAVSFLMTQGVLCYYVVSYQTTPVWFVKNEYLIGENQCLPKFTA